MPATSWFATLVSAAAVAEERVVVMTPLGPTALANTWHASSETAELLTDDFLYLPCARPDDVIGIDAEAVAAEMPGSVFFGLPARCGTKGTHEVSVARRTARKNFPVLRYALDAARKAAQEPSVPKC